MRHLMLEFPDDKNSYNMEHYEYLFGSDLLVAPVVEHGARTRKVYLPGKGVKWTDFWTGKTYASHKEITVDAPLGRTPVFFKTENRLLAAASKKSRQLRRSYEGKNMLNPVCLPGYSYKIENDRKIPCKDIK